MKHRLVVLALLAITVSGCAAGRAFRKGQEAERAGDYDTAVAEFTRAVQEDPTHAEFRISLERATQNASRDHITKAHELELHDQLDSALLEYKRAVELDGTNRLAAARATELEKTIRDRIEASRPRPAIEKMREDARAQSLPLLNPASREPIPLINFNNASLKDILNFLSTQSGINITYDPAWHDKAYTVRLEGVTLEQALQQILSANTSFYKVTNPKTILIADDTAPMHQKYDEMVIRVFYISHADVTELTATLNTVMRIQTMPVQPMILPNKTANTITARASAQVMDVIERVIRANDKPRAEVIIDVQILEVSKKRTKDLGINLSNYSLGLTFSPEVAPPNTSGGATPGNPPPFNLNTISQGISTADFYLSVPTAVIKFLEQDSHTKLIAKPQLRGAEGTKLTLNLGDQIPVLSTVFGAPAAGGFASVPQSSFNYKDVGVNIAMTPRVTYEGDIVLDGFSVESSALGPSISVAGQDVPSFSSRKVETKLRLREGESTLLAGLLRDEQRKILNGFPGIMRVPILRSLFGQSSDEVNQSDIVMLLTPHIVRTHELTTEDLAPIYIGTQSSIGLGGPPPLIAPQPEAPPVAAPAAPAVTSPGFAPVPGGNANPPGGAQPTNPPLPPGVSPVPTLVTPLPATGATPPGATPPGATPPGATPPRDVPMTPPSAPGAAAPATQAQIIVTPPGTEFRIAGGPYTVPVSINNASRVSMVTLTITYNPNVLRVRTVQDGTFMRQGGVAATFTPRIDASAGRVDIAIARTSDQTGASGAGLLAGLIFDAVGPGGSIIQVSGIANTPEGAPIALIFSPVTVTVR